MGQLLVGPTPLWPPPTQPKFWVGHQGRIQEFVLGGHPLFPPFPLEVGSPHKPAKGSGERCKLPSGVLGGALAENEFGAL